MPSLILRMKMAEHLSVAKDRYENIAEILPELRIKTVEHPPLLGCEIWSSENAPRTVLVYQEIAMTDSTS